jgi:hypothetical protein
MEQQWRKEQQDYTRKIILNVDVVAFMVQWGGENKGCCLDHLDGRFGYITLEDAMDYIYKVYDYQTDELLNNYQTLDQLIEDGWKVST